MPKRKPTEVINRSPDTIVDDNGVAYRITEASPNKIITVRGRHIRVADIPLVAVVLTCGHPVRGIALSVKDVVFCDHCQKTAFVKEVVAK